MITKKTLYEEIKNAIRKKGITIKNFENDFGIARGTIRQTFKARKINIQLIYSIYKNLNIPSKNVDKYLKC